MSQITASPRPTATAPRRTSAGLAGLLALVGGVWAVHHLVKPPEPNLPEVTASEARATVTRFEDAVNNRSRSGVDATLDPGVQSVAPDGTTKSGDVAVSQFWSGAPQGHGLTLEGESVAARGLAKTVTATASDPGDSSHVTGTIVFTIGTDGRIDRIELRD